MTTQPYIRAFIGNQLRTDTALHFIAERQVEQITAAKVRDQHGQVVDGYRLNMVDDQAFYALSLRTFLIHEIEAEIERGIKLGREAESPIT